MYQKFGSSKGDSQDPNSAYQNIKRAAQNTDSKGDWALQKFLQRASKPYSGPTWTRVQRPKAVKTLVI